MKYYITFGQIHTHRVNGQTLDCDCVAALEAESVNSAHEAAMTMFDAKFHQCTEKVPPMEYYPSGIIDIGSA